MRVDIGMPVYSGLDGDPLAAIERARRRLDAGVCAEMRDLAPDVTPGAIHFTSECGWVDYARAEIVESFRRGGSDALLFHDQDITPTPGAFWGLCRALLDASVDVAFCTYRLRRPPHSWIITPAVNYSILTSPSTELNRPGLAEGAPRKIIEVGSGPLGFTLLSREALLRLTEEWPELESNRRSPTGFKDGTLFEFFQPMIHPDTNEHLGEDAAFFFRCVESRLRIACLVDGEVIHAGVGGRFSDHL